MTGSDDVLFHIGDHIAYVTLNRPEHGNALTAAMMRRFRDIWTAIGSDPEVRCVLLSASGDRHFCTGADLHDVARTGSVAAGLGPVSQELFLTSRHNGVWKPTVCAVNGLVAGAGLHFVVDADIVVASSAAAFLDSHVNVGMVGAVENVGLAKRLPLGTALRMTLQGRNFRLSAARAHQLGLVEEVVEPMALQQVAEQIAHDISLNSPQAVSLSQQAVWAGLDMGYPAAQEYGYALVRMHWQHPDFGEGPRAFTEGRRPVWTTS